jgi:hypothetical protein
MTGANPYPRFIRCTHFGRLFKGDAAWFCFGLFGIRYRETYK